MSEIPRSLYFPRISLLVRVQVHGSAAGGDADELRLLSTSDVFINLRAHGGSLDFLSTKVRDWLRIIGQ